MKICTYGTAPRHFVFDPWSIDANYVRCHPAVKPAKGPAQQDSRAAKPGKGLITAMPGSSTWTMQSLWEVGTWSWCVGLGAGAWDSREKGKGSIYIHTYVTPRKKPCCADRRPRKFALLPTPSHTSSYPCCRWATPLRRRRPGHLASAPLLWPELNWSDLGFRHLVVRYRA